MDGRIEHPAELPIRGFTPLVIAHAIDADSTLAASAIADRLGASGTVAEVVPSSAMSPSTPYSGESTGLVVELEVRVTPRVETVWTTRPDSVCGISGCYTRYFQYPTYVNSLLAVADVRVREAATNRVLAMRTARAEVSGIDTPTRRNDLRAILVSEVVVWFDPHDEIVRVRFPRGSGAPYAHAVAAARAGRWDDAAVELRAIRDAPGFRALDASARADVLHALALTVRFGGGAHDAPRRSLDEAIALLDEAIAIRRDDALVTLRQAMQDQVDEARVLERQRGGTDVAASLPVPESYR